MQLLRRYQLGLILLMIFSGCAASQLDLSLKGTSIQTLPASQHPVPATLGVDVFVDLRPQSHGDDNKKWLGLIPGILWLKIDSDIPEFYTSCSPYNSRPFNETAAEGVTDALNRSGLIQKVISIPADPYTAFDYRLEGVLRRSLVRETSYYYGSFLYVWAFRMLGFPYVSYEINLELDLRLRNMSNDRIIWEGKIAGDIEDRYRNVYALARGTEGKHLIAYNFSKILEEKLPQMIVNMHHALVMDATPR